MPTGILRTLPACLEACLTPACLPARASIMILFFCVMIGYFYIEIRGLVSKSIYRGSESWMYIHKS